MDANLLDVKGKIVLVTGGAPGTIEKIQKAGAIGYISVHGSLFDPEEMVSEIRTRNEFKKPGDESNFPGVVIHIKDAQKLLRMNPEEINIVLKQDGNKKGTSHNVVATIMGSELPEEIITFSAHYDSVKFSTGAYDNGTGSTTILEALAYFNEFKPKRTLKFVWCGSEEMGLLGSKAYTEAHKDELEAYKLCINIDMTGVVIGKDIACCTTKASFADYINYVGKEVGFNISARQGVYSSDSTPFADKGVPAISFARLAPRGGAEIHSRKDVIDFLDSKNYYRTCEFINYFADKMDKAWTVPVERIIPDEMKKELDIYLGRKERDGK